MNECGHQLYSVDQAWSGTMEQAALDSEDALFADGGKVSPRWTIAKKAPLGHSSALRKTAGQQEDDFWRFSSQLIDSDARRRLSFASQARISASKLHHLCDPHTGGHERIKPAQTKNARVIFRRRLFRYVFKSSCELSDQLFSLRPAPRCRPDIENVLIQS